MDLTCSFKPMEHNSVTMRNKKLMVKFNSKSNLFPHDFFDVQQLKQLGETPTFQLQKNAPKPRALSCRNGHESTMQNIAKIINFKEETNKENRSINSKNIPQRRSTQSTTTLPQIKRSRSDHQPLLKQTRIKSQQNSDYVSVRALVDRSREEVSQYSSYMHPENSIHYSTNQVEHNFDSLYRQPSNKSYLLRALNQSQLANLNVYNTVNPRKAGSTHVSVNESSAQHRNLLKVMKRRIVDSDLCRFFQ